VKLYWVPTVTPVMGVPDIVAVAGVPVALTLAVDDTSGLTVTPSPPPQPAKVRVSETSAVAQMALISLNRALLGKRKCRRRGKRRTRASTTRLCSPTGRGVQCKSRTENYIYFYFSDLCRCKQMTRNRRAANLSRAADRFLRRTELGITSP